MNIPIATAYGFDSIGQGVPPAGLENLLTDIETGNLDGITMLQLRAPVPSKSQSKTSTAYRIDVEYISDTPGKPSIKIRLGEGEISTPTSTTILKSLREELVASAKRIVQCVEQKGCRIYACTFEFVSDRSKLQLLRGKDIKTSSLPNELEPVPGAPHGGPNMMPPPLVSPTSGTQLPPSSLSPTGMPPTTTRATHGADTFVVSSYPNAPQGTYPHTASTPLTVLDLTTPLPQAIHSPALNPTGPSSSSSSPTAPAPPSFASGHRSISVPSAAFARQPYGNVHAVTGLNTPASLLAFANLPSIDPTLLVEVPLGPNDKENTSKLQQQLRRAQDVLREVQAAAVAAKVSTGVGVEHAESAALKELRKAGSFEYSEDPLPPDNTPNREQTLVNLLMQTRKKWKEAVQYANAVTSVVTREKLTAIMDMSNLHKQEVQELRGSIAALEDRLLQLQAEANNLSSDLSASVKREEYTKNRLSRSQAEVKRLHNDLQTIITLQSSGAEGGAGAGNRVPAVAQPSPRRPAIPASGAAGPLVSKSNANLRAGAEIVGAASLPSPAASSVVSAGNYLSPTADIQTVFSAGDNGATLAGLQAHLRQLQAEIAGVREELAGEVDRNLQLKSSHAKTLDEFRAERRRLLALLAEKDSEEEYKTVKDALAEESNVLEAELNGTSDAEDGMNSPVPMGLLLRRSREINALRSTVATLRTELTHAMDSQKQALLRRSEIQAKLEALVPAKAALEAQVTALKNEVQVLRNTMTMKPSLDAAQTTLEDPQAPMNASFGVDSPNGSGGKQAEMSMHLMKHRLASEQATVAQLSAEANLLRSELRGLREQYSSTRMELLKTKDALAEMIANNVNAREAEHRRLKEERERITKELTESSSLALNTALHNARTEISNRYSNQISELKAEVSDLQHHLEKKSEEVLRLQSVVDAYSNHAKNAEGAGGVQGMGGHNAHSGPHSTFDRSAASLNPEVVLARSALLASQATVSVLRKELASTRSEHAHTLQELRAAHTQALAQAHLASAGEVAKAVEKAENEWRSKLEAETRKLREEHDQVLEALKKQATQDINTRLMHAEEERTALYQNLTSQHAQQLKTAVEQAQQEAQEAQRNALAKAKQEWEEPLTNALSSIQGTGGAGAQAVSAEAMQVAVANVRRELEGSIGKKLNEAQAELKQVRSALEHAQSMLRSKDDTIAELMNDIKNRSLEERNMYAESLKTQEAEAASKLHRTVTLLNQQAEITLNNAVKLESERWLKKLAALEVSHATILEQRLQAQKATLMAEHELAMEKLKLSYQNQLPIGASESLDSMNSITVQKHKMKEQHVSSILALLEQRNSSLGEIAALQTKLQSSLETVAALQAEAVRKEEAHREEIYNLRLEREKRISSLEALLAGYHDERDAMTGRFNAALEALREKSDAEIAVVRKHCATEIGAMLANVESQVQNAVLEAVDAEKRTQQEKAEAQIKDALLRARKSIMQELTQAGTVSATHQLQDIENKWAEKLQDLEQHWNNVLDAMEERLRTNESQRVEERRALLEQMETNRVIFNTQLDQALRNANEKADILRRNMEAAFVTEKKEALRAAIEKAIESSQAAWYLEKESLEQKHRAALHVMKMDLEHALSVHRAEVARDMETAMSTLRSEFAVALETTTNAVRSEMNYSLAAEKEKAVQTAISQHANVVGDLRTQLTKAKEDLLVAERKLKNLEESHKEAEKELIRQHQSTLESRLRETEMTWQAKYQALQADNDQAATIISGLLREADESAARLETLTTAQAAIKDQHAKQMAQEAAAHAKEIQELVKERQTAVQKVTQEAKALTESMLEEAHAAFQAEKARMEAEWGAERAALMAPAAQQGGGVVSRAVDEARAALAKAVEAESSRSKNLLEAFTSKLRAEHAQEIERLRVQWLREKEKEIAALKERHNEAMKEIVVKTREETTAQVSLKFGHLEAEVQRELGQANRAATASNAQAIAELETAHTKAIEAFHREWEDKLANQNRLMRQIQDHLSSLIAQKDAEIIALREGSLPLAAVSELREALENQANASVAVATEEAISSVRAEAEAAQSVLREKLLEAEKECRALRSDVELLQKALEQSKTRAAATIRASEERAEKALKALQDARRAPGSPKSDESKTAIQAAQENERWLQQQLTETQQELRRVMHAKAAEIEAAVASQVNAWMHARESLLSEITRLESELASTKASLQEALAEREARNMDLASQVKNLTDKVNLVQNEGADALRAELRSTLEAERMATEARTQEALMQGVMEALEAGKSDKEESLQKLKEEFAAQLAAFEKEAENLRESEKKALIALHKAEMEALIAQSVLDRDAAVAKERESKGSMLETAQSYAADMLEAARAEHAAAIETLKKSFEAEKQELIQQAAEDLKSTLEAAKEEMTGLLAAADTAWQNRSAGLLAAQAEEHSRAVMELHAIVNNKSQEFMQEKTNVLMAAEEARAKLIAQNQQYLNDALATAQAQAEADKVAALGAFNAEWVTRMNERAAELIEARQAELDSLRAEYQEQLEATVNTLEAQRQGALTAFAAEFEAERARMKETTDRALAEAIAAERAAAEQAVTAALQRAEEEKHVALAELSERLAEERAQAIAAVRQQATEEQEEAMDALRIESEKLLNSIEGAMTKLRDERDAAGEDQRILETKLEAEKKKVAALQNTIAALRRSGAIATMKSYILAGRYVTKLAEQREMAEQRRENDLKRLDREWMTRFTKSENTAIEWRRKFWIMVRMRMNLAETLSGFKKEILVQHKIKSTGLAQVVANLTEQKNEITRQEAALASQVAEIEGTIRTLEKEMAELSKQSVIEKDGTVNVTLTRRKKRLDRDLDSALIRLGDRREALAEVSKTAKEIDQERILKEEELKQIESNVVATLVMQQRELMNVINQVPLEQQQLNLPPNFDMSLLDPPPQQEEDEEYPYNMQNTSPTFESAKFMPQQQLTDATNLLHTQVF